MIFNNLNFLPTPKYCQTCGIEKNNNNVNDNEEGCHYSFCSNTKYS